MALDSQRVSRSTGHSRLFPVSAVVLLAWGALAFGSEYAWAYAPLIVFSVAVGSLGVAASSNPKFPSPLLAISLVAIFLAAAIQLLPISPRAMATVSPNRTEVD